MLREIPFHAEGVGETAGQFAVLLFRVDDGAVEGHQVTGGGNAAVGQGQRIVGVDGLFLRPCWQRGVGGDSGASTVTGAGLLIGDC